MGRALEARERELAKERQREAGKRGSEGGRGKKKTLTQTLCKGKRDDNTTSRRIAKALGLSGPTREKLKAVVDSGDAKLIAEMDRTGKMAGPTYTRHRRRPGSLRVTRRTRPVSWDHPKRKRA